MSEYIKRKDANVRLWKQLRRLSDLIPMGKDAAGVAVRIIEDLPAADVVEIVRCKNCMHNGSIDTDCPFGWKDKKFNMPKPNDYCSYGERKEQENEYTD